MDNDDLKERIHALETAQATQAATAAGAQTTQGAAQAGMMATMVTGSVSLIVGMILGFMFSSRK
jgi:F0F1-type ATP synthase assembly protein I